MTFYGALNPVGAGGVVETGCGIGFAGDIAGNDYGVAVCDREVEERAGFDVLQGESVYKGWRFG